MVSYTGAAQVGRAYLLARYNGVLTFVEDSTATNMHVRMLRQICKGRAEIENVFPLGNRKAVIDRALSDQSASIPPRIYVVDGDSDYLAGMPIPTSRNLYRLDAYCVENLLLEEEGLVELICECQPDADRATARSLLSTQVPVGRVADALLPLFAVYAVSYALNLGIETVSYKVVRLCTVQNNPATLSPVLVAKRTRQVRNEIVSQVGWPTYRRVKAAVDARLSAALNPIRLISGKDYLFPLLQGFLRGQLGHTDSTEKLKVRLAAHYDPKVEPHYRDFVLRALT